MARDTADRVAKQFPNVKLEDQAITELSIPGGQLLIYIVIAGVVGVGAAAFPAWRAARLEVLSAISYE